MFVGGCRSSVIRTCSSIETEEDESSYHIVRVQWWQAYNTWLLRQERVGHSDRSAMVSSRPPQPVISSHHSLTGMQISRDYGSSPWLLLAKISATPFSIPPPKSFSDFETINKRIRVLIFYSSVITWKTRHIVCFNHTKGLTFCIPQSHVRFNIFNSSIP